MLQLPEERKFMSDSVEKASSAITGTQHNHFTRVARNAGWIVLLSLLGYYALFRLPFRFPPRTRLWSASYAFGYNNGVAILSMAILLGGVALFYIWRRGGVADLRVNFPLEGSERKSLRWTLAVVSLLYVALTFAMYIYYMRTASWLMWEVRHFLHRTWLMDTYGLRPYTQFSAEYGPLLTSTPLYVRRLLTPLNASLEQAYFASHLLLNLGGLWCIYYVLACAKMPPLARIVAFVILAIAGFAPYMGLNGVLLRYLAPLACLILGHRIFVRTLSVTATGRWWPGAVFTILGLVALNVMLSPEAAVAFALAWLGYGMLKIRREARILFASLVAFGVVGLICWLVLPAAYYGSLLHFSEGANNLPLLPAAHLLLYIVTLFLVVPRLLACGMEEHVSDGVPAVSGALGILCLAMIPGALGRCDPPHVLFFGMSASMLLMIGVANLSRRAFATYAVAYGFVFIVLMQVVNLRVFFGVSRGVLLSRHPFINLTERLRSANGTDRPSAATLSALDRYPRLGLPFATFGDPVVEKYVLARGQLDPEYYISVVGVYTEAALQRKLNDISKMEYLLMPRPTEPRKPAGPCAEYLKSLRHWFLYPARLPCRADPLDPGASVNHFIAGHFVSVEHVGSWVVLRRNTGVP
jgi:hypothetical protein